MNIGFVGLGKLGLPVALTIQSKGHAVLGYDINAGARARAVSARLDLAEDDDALVAGADLVFVAIQTPHDPRYEGVTRLPEERRDFDYRHLVAGVTGIARAIRYTDSQAVVAVISTVLPGTTERLLKPVLGGIPMVYNPSFIAMGTVERDYVDPEFVLLGVDDAGAAELAEKFYRTITDAPLYCTAIRNAELIKVAYNTFIGMKLAFANTLMEICHKTGCDVDAVTGALKMATKRLISPAYLDAGMGDGGACHPRDNIALSWLARELGLSFDLFEAVMLARERQAEWLVDLMCEYDLPKAILGTQYKPGTDIRTGSHALLVKALLEERGHTVYEDEVPEPCAVLIGCKEPRYATYGFPRGSVVLDVWRYIPDRDGITVIRVGRARDRDLSVVR